MRKLFFILALAIGACSAPVTDVQNESVSSGPWALVEEVSTVSFVSIKKGDISEAHEFTSLTGHVDADGQAVVSIVLDSVQTHIDVRNERMREHLFETNLHPFATIKMGVDIGSLLTLTQGQRQQAFVMLDVDLHGMAITVEADVFITNIGGNRVLVESRVPVLVHAQDYALMDGVAKLQELAKLPAISPAVPVSFSLVFESED